LTTTFRRLDFELGDWDYVQEHLPGFLYVADVRGIVAIRKGKIGGVYMFDHWAVTTCHWHHIITDRRVLVEGLLEEAWGWVFSPKGGKRTKVFGYIPQHLEASQRLANRLGAEEVFRLKDGLCVGVDLVINEITKESCRYS
jgi:hypothetical protein